MAGGDLTNLMHSIAIEGRIGNRGLSVDRVCDRMGYDKV